MFAHKNVGCRSVVSRLSVGLWFHMRWNYYLTLYESAKFVLKYETAMLVQLTKERFFTKHKHSLYRLGKTTSWTPLRSVKMFICHFYHKSIELIDVDRCKNRDTSLESTTKWKGVLLNNENIASSLKLKFKGHISVKGSANEIVCLLSVVRRIQRKSERQFSLLCCQWQKLR